jgi:hypothetical protein
MSTLLPYSNTLLPYNTHHDDTILWFDPSYKINPQVITVNKTFLYYIFVIFFLVDSFSDLYSENKSVVNVVELVVLKSPQRHPNPNSIWPFETLLPF